MSPDRPLHHARPSDWSYLGYQRIREQTYSVHTRCLWSVPHTQPCFLPESWHQGKSEAVKVKWTEFLSRLCLIKMKQFPACFLFEMWALTVKALLFTLIEIRLHQPISMVAVAPWQELYNWHPTQSFMLACAHVHVQSREMAHGQGVAARSSDGLTTFL